MCTYPCMTMVDSMPMSRILLPGNPFAAPPSGWKLSISGCLGKKKECLGKFQLARDLSAKNA